jgi:putative ABC transport system substrate-binding protein
MKSSKIALVVLLLLISFGVTKTFAQDKIPTVAYLTFSPEIFEAAMGKLGYVDGQNVNFKVLHLENVKPEDFFTEITNQTQAILDSGVDVLVVNTDTDAVNLAPKAGNIPIVFILSDDPVATGVAKSLLKPGGNVTGSVTNKPHERRLQILTEIKPSTKKVYYLYSTMTGDAETVLHQVQAVAKTLNVEIVPGPMTDLPSAMEALKNTPDDVDWLFFTPYVPFDMGFYEEASKIALAHKAGISGFINTPVPNWLMGYGPDFNVALAATAPFVDRILRGASPADLPIGTAENFLTVNLEAAQKIDLPISEGILRQANLIVRPGFFNNPPPTPAK